MLAIRLLRTGRRNQPAFKIVVTRSTNPPAGGRFVEELGFVNPLTKERNVNKERATYWLSVGARPSDSVHNIFITEEVISGKKIAVHAEKPVDPSQKTAPSGATKEVEPDMQPDAPQENSVSEDANESVSAPEPPERKEG